MLQLETNTYFFRGEGDYQFITPLDLPIKALMEKLGVKLNAKQTLRRKFLPQFDFNQ